MLLVAVLRVAPPAGIQMLDEGSPRVFVSCCAFALRIVNSPVTISSPSAIITAPPKAMITGKCRLTTASAAVTRSNASAISRKGMPSPAE